MPSSKPKFHLFTELWLYPRHWGIGLLLFLVPVAIGSWLLLLNRDWSAWQLFSAPNRPPVAAIIPIQVTAGEAVTIDIRAHAHDPDGLPPPTSQVRTPAIRHRRADRRLPLPLPSATAKPGGGPLPLPDPGRLRRPKQRLGLRQQRHPRAQLTHSASTLTRRTTMPFVGSAVRTAWTLSSFNLLEEQSVSGHLEKFKAPARGRNAPPRFKVPWSTTRA